MYSGKVVLYANYYLLLTTSQKKETKKIIHFLDK